MAEIKESLRAIQQPARIALIPILLAVLAGTLHWSSNGDEIASNDSTGTEIDSDATSTSKDSVPQATVDPTFERRRKTLATIGLGDILEHNPFALPQESGSLLKPEPNESIVKQDQVDQKRRRIEEVVRKILSEKIDLVFQDEHGTAARLGTRIVHVGEELEEGIRIVEITLQGLVLQVPEN